MSKKEAIKVLSDAGYTQLKELPSHIETFLNATLKKACDVSFSASRLVYASRDWVDTESGFDGVFNSVLNAAQSMTGGRRTRGCDLLPYHKVTPDGPMDSVAIGCGARSISIEKMHFANSMVIYAIREEIGTPSGQLP
jgi:hypothetical protein